MGTVTLERITQSLRMDADCEKGLECGDTCISKDFVCESAATQKTKALAGQAKKALLGGVSNKAVKALDAGKQAVDGFKTVALSNAPPLDRVLALGAIALTAGGATYALIRERHRSGYDSSAEVARRMGESFQTQGLGDKRQVTFTVDSPLSYGTGRTLRNAMRGDSAFSDHLIIPTLSPLNGMPTNPYTDPVRRTAYEAVFGARAYFTSAVEGRSREAEELAARIHAYARANPNARINLVGAGPGGHVVQDAISIYSRINQERARGIKVVALNTPELDIADRAGIQKTVTNRGWFGLLPMRNKVTVDSADDGTGVGLALSSYVKGFLRSDATATGAPTPGVQGFQGGGYRPGFTTTTGQATPTSNVSNELTKDVVIDKVVRGEWTPGQAKKNSPGISPSLVDIAEKAYAYRSSNLRGYLEEVEAVAKEQGKKKTDPGVVQTVVHRWEKRQRQSSAGSATQSQPQQRQQNQSPNPATRRPSSPAPDTVKGLFEKAIAGVDEETLQGWKSTGRFSYTQVEAARNAQYLPYELQKTDLSAVAPETVASLGKMFKRYKTETVQSGPEQRVADIDNIDKVERWTQIYNEMLDKHPNKPLHTILSKAWHQFDIIENRADSLSIDRAIARLGYKTRLR